MSAGSKAADHAAIAALIGRPWSPGATGPAAFDCRGLVAHVLRALGRPVPVLIAGGPPPSFAAARAGAAEDGWRPVPAAVPPLEGDVLLCYGAAGAHVGVFVRYGRLGVLHAVQPPAAAAGVQFHLLADLLAAGAFGRPSVWRHAP